jgi:Uma2 family endonuclease
MTALPSPLYSWPEYLAWEIRYPDTKWELHGGVIMAMTGGSVPHAAAISELTALLVPAARAHGCRAYSNDVRLRIEGSWSFYPDLGVYCDPEDDDQQFRERPCLLIEVAAPSTRRIDRTEKLAAYTGLASLLAYVVVEPAEQTITVFRRSAGWAPVIYQRGELIDLPCPLITVDVAAVFA